MKRIFTISLLALSFLAFAGGGYNVGDKARDFKLKNIDGNMISLKDFKKAEGFIIIFTCNHCPYAQAVWERVVSIAHILCCMKIG